MDGGRSFPLVAADGFVGGGAGMVWSGGADTLFYPTVYGVARLAAGGEFSGGSGRSDYHKKKKESNISLRGEDQKA